MIPRIITAILGIPILVLIIGFGQPWHFSLMMILVTGVALWEYFTLVFPGQRVAKISWVIAGILVFFGNLRSAASLYLSLAAILFIGAFSVYLSRGGKSSPSRRRLIWSLLGLLYLGYFLSYWVFLYEGPVGKEWVFFVLLVVMAGDTAGYFVGTRFGRRKIYPRISPHKTLEGTLGVLVGGILAGLLGSQLLFFDLSLGEAFWLSLFLGVLGQGGDLFESWIKRSFAVKDSGALLPGHGGLLDRMDSLIFPTVLTAHYVKLFHS